MSKKFLSIVVFAIASSIALSVGAAKEINHEKYRATVTLRVFDSKTGFRAYEDNLDQNIGIELPMGLIKRNWSCVRVKLAENSNNTITTGFVCNDGLHTTRNGIVTCSTVKNSYDGAWMDITGGDDDGKRSLDFVATCSTEVSK